MLVVVLILKNNNISKYKTQIPSKYKYTYTLMGNVIIDEFENINPDEYNESIGLTENQLIATIQKSMT